MALDGRAHRVAVVLDDEEDRTHPVLAPEAGHVHRFVKRADVHRAVAEVADGNALGLLVSKRVRSAGSERQMPTDDAIAAVKTVLDVEQVHRPALAFGNARALPQNLAPYA